jgi:long-subunit fatty acid transport protein
VNNGALTTGHQYRNQLQITPNWAAELDYNFTRWSELKNLNAHFSTSLPALGGLAPISGFYINTELERHQ